MHVHRGLKQNCGCRQLSKLASVRIPRRQRPASTHQHTRLPLHAIAAEVAATGHQPSEHSQRVGHVDEAQYKDMYKRSLEDPEGFWGDIASTFHWEKKWDEKHFHHNFDIRKGPISVEWFRGGVTNIAYNALDRHVQAGHGAMPCFLFEGNDVGHERSISYQEVLEEVCRVANWLRSQGVGKGDAVALYMCMGCELPIAMLACARIGAVHSVVFGGFSAEALAERMADCRAKALIVSSGVMRGPKRIEFKKIADQALVLSEKLGWKVPTCLVHDNSTAVPRSMCPMTEGRDHLWQDALKAQSPLCPVEWVDAEHPLFLLYTSGSTGKPKGVLHTTGGYMVYSATTTKYVFGMQPGDVFFNTADCGWITGHSYLTYGPLLNRVTSVVFEGVPTYPTPSRCWEIVERHRVTRFYTAPTAIRTLMRHGDAPVKQHDLSSLQVLGSVGEPINPEAWKWYHSVVGNGRCAIVDTWWQTETGGHMITPLPGAWAERPGSATLPFFGVVPALLDEQGNEVEGEGEGYLCIKRPWPSTLRTIYGNQERYENAYFAPFKGYYFTGDGARRDADGYYWITGRVDDVINVSGHRIGTAELESALVAHPHCAEAAVVGYEHPIKGQGIYAYVTLMEGVEAGDQVRKDLVNSVRQHIGAFAAPDVIHWAPGLPKTRSGKIMRRVLRKIASQEEDQLGDVSTLADPSVVKTLVELRGR